MTMRITRRRLLLGLGGAGLGAAGACAASRLRDAAPLGPRELDLIAKAWDGLDPARVLDTHVHVAGLGADGTGCWVNPNMRSPTHPLNYVEFRFYVGAGGIKDVEHGDREYMERLRTLMRDCHPHGRLLLFPFAFARTDAGVEDREGSEFHVPNEYVSSLARQNPEFFRPACSIHPYDPEAVTQLRESRRQGAVAVKWLPNAMNIDPASPRCDAFYEAQRELGMPLITHSGEEKAVHSDRAQRLGNPLRLRRPLEHGVKVVIAHCASLGTNADIDLPEGENAPAVDNFDLFVRVFTDPRYEKNVFADISAMTQVNRCERPLREVLMHPEWHPRLVNGSDYPLPAVDFIIRTGKLASLGYITHDERTTLNAIFDRNPLLFDFVAKRTLHIEDQGRRFSLSPSIFMPPEGLFPA
jgi:uncharacterized protein